MNSEWWMLHSYSCLNISYLELKKDSFVLYISKPRENLCMKGVITYTNDTILTRIDGSSESSKGFILNKNEIIILPDLIRIIKDKGFEIPDTILVNKKNYLHGLERGKRIKIKKKMKILLGS